MTVYDEIPPWQIDAEALLVDYWPVREGNGRWRLELGGTWPGDLATRARAHAWVLCQRRGDPEERPAARRWPRMVAHRKPASRQP